MIKKVAIIGGTHGNEITGIYLLKRWDAERAEITRDSFTTITLWANPRAFYENKRFIDVDLNRCFLLDELNDKRNLTYEGQRAKAINALLGPKHESAVDFIIDIHTTTSNMGVTLILFEGRDEFAFRMASFIKSHIPTVNVYLFKDQGEDLPYLVSIAPRRLVLEIGPVPQGLLRHDIFERTNRVVQLALDYIQIANVGGDSETASDLEVFEHKSVVRFPLDAAGEINGMVHVNLQDKDFSEVNKGDPLFIKLNGEIVRFEDDQPVYPVFINEAAYYDAKIALSLTHKTMRKIPGSLL